MDIEFKSPLMKELSARGFLHSCTNAEDLDARLADGEIMTVYAGFDCTADSLHVGNLMSLMLLRLFKNHGHKIVPLIGTATSQIGDPSGKNTARPLMDRDTINKNAKGILKSITHILGDITSFPNPFSGEFGDEGSRFFNNADWTENVNLIDFLRDVGRKISINSMLNLESVSRRLDGNGHMSFQEFTYSLLQAHDFLKLHEHWGVNIQIGGSDQWGNITMGTELIRKTHNDAAVFGITHPLLTNSAGEKMGKSVNGAIWLNEEKLSNFEFWQFWRNVDDKDVRKLLKLFTGFVHHNELTHAINIHVADNDDIFDVDFSNVDINSLKILLATEVTDLVRGFGTGGICRQTAESIFSGKLSDNMNTIDVMENASLVEVLVECKFCDSKGDARRAIIQGAIRFNDVTVTDTFMVLTEEGKLSKGKKNHIKVIINKT